MTVSFQKTFYKNLHNGKYKFPEGLYSTVITAVEMRNEKEIRIHPQERPTQLERLKDKLGLKGIDFERVKTDGNQECKNFEYTVIIKPKSFLSNLSMFYDASMDRISDDNAAIVASSLQMQNELASLKDKLEQEKQEKVTSKPKKEKIETDVTTEAEEKVIEKPVDDNSDLGSELLDIIEKIVKVE